MRLRSALAQTLGAKDALAEHSAEREMLLLLDDLNLARLVEAGGGFERSRLLDAEVEVLEGDLGR